MESHHFTGVVDHPRACDIPAWRKVTDRDVGRDDTATHILKTVKRDGRPGAGRTLRRIGDADVDRGPLPDRRGVRIEFRVDHETIAGHPRVNRWAHTACPQRGLIGHHEVAHRERPTRCHLGVDRMVDTATLTGGIDDGHPQGIGARRDGQRKRRLEDRSILGVGRRSGDLLLPGQHRRPLRIAQHDPQGQLRGETGRHVDFRSHQDTHLLRLRALIRVGRDL